MLLPYMRHNMLLTADYAASRHAMRLYTALLIIALLLDADADARHVLRYDLPVAALI